MQRQTHSSACGVTLIEVLVSVAVLALTTVAMTQSMLVLNKNSAIARARNLAKATVLGRINEVAAVAYDPTANPPVTPSILNTGTVTSSVDLGDSSTGVGRVPATMKWTVAAVGTTSVLSVRCRVDYQFLNRNQSYEVLTFRSPD